MERAACCRQLFLGFIVKGEMNGQRGNLHLKLPKDTIRLVIRMVRKLKSKIVEA